MKKYKLPKMKQGGVAKDTHKTKDGKTAKKGLYYYMNRKKKKGTSNPKSESTVSDKAYANMKAGFPKMRNGGVASDPPKKPIRIKIDKSNWEDKGLSHPTTTQGYNQLMTKAYEGLKKDEQYQVKCSGNEQCAGQNNTLLKNMKDSLSNELGYKTEYKRKRRDAWNFPDDSYEVLYTNSYYKPQIENKLKGNKKALIYKKMLPDKSLFMPAEEGKIDPFEGALVVGDRANDTNSHIWATQYKKDGNTGTEHSGILGPLMKHPKTGEVGRFIYHGFAGKEGGSKNDKSQTTADWISEKDGWGYSPDENKYSIAMIYKDKDLQKLQYEKMQKNKEAKLKQQIGSQMKELQSTLDPNMFINPVESTKQPIIIPNRYGSISFKYGGIMPNQSFCNCNYKKIK